MSPRNPSIIDLVQRNAVYAQNCLSDPVLLSEKAELKQNVLTDFQQLRELADNIFDDPLEENEVCLLAGELAMAVNSVVESGDTEILKREEQRVREAIRKLLG